MELTGNINNRTWADVHVGRETFKLKDSQDNRTWVDVCVNRDTSWKGRDKQSHLGGRLYSYRHLQVMGTIDNRTWGDVYWKEGRMWTKG